MESSGEGFTHYFTEFETTLSTTTTKIVVIEPHEKLFHTWEGLLVTILLGILCVFGLVANALTFFVICSSRKLRTSPFNILILSLCMSDFLSALNSPFQIYRRIWGYLEFDLPLGFCKFTVGLSQWTMFVTVQHILVFGVFRLLAIQFPNKIKKFSARWAKITAIFIWVEVFFVSALFYLMASTVIPYKPGRYKTACTSVSKDWRDIAGKYTTYALPILLFAPFIAIMICALIIVISMIQVRRKRANAIASQKKSSYGTTGQEQNCLPSYKEMQASQQTITEKIQERENVAMLQVTLIVFSFLLGYSAEAAYRMTKILNLRDLFTVRTKWLTLTVAYILLRISECLNPLFYNLSSRKTTNRQTASTYQKQKKKMSEKQALPLCKSNTTGYKLGVKYEMYTGVTTNSYNPDMAIRM
uniref:uncharacterized protein LOC120345772 isoform X1 n=1 Tax=Styela clava TaxID=7725 RepID=UPI00193AC69E|nr:uncharacterized protein LOC120345772 isoform X1 [Styela clava]